MLTKNEGQMDRAARLVVGLILLVVGSFLTGWLQIILYILAILSLVTAATGFCWLYKLIGFNTAGDKAEEQKPAEAEEEKTEADEAPIKTSNDTEEANLMVEEEPVEENKEEEVTMPAETEEAKTEETATEEPKEEEAK